MSVNELLETRQGANIQAYRGCGATVIRPMSLDHTHGFDLGTSHIGCKEAMNWATRQPCPGPPEAIPLPVLRFNREEAWAGRPIYQNKREEARISDALDQKHIANVSVAEAPTTPALPSDLSPLMVLFVGLVLASSASLGAAFAVNKLNLALRHPDDVRTILDVPVLASFPKVLTESVPS